MGNQRSSSKTTQTPPQPWSGQQPYLLDLYKRAEQAYQQPLEYYPESTLAEVDPTLQQAWGQTAELGRRGTDVGNAASNLATRTMGGEFMGQNPYLDQMYGRAAQNVTRQFQRSVLPELESRFARAGRVPSGALQAGRGEAMRSLAGELGGMATDIYGGAYETERGRQERAMGMAPSLSAMRYSDLDRMRQVGAEKTMRGQQELEDLISRFDFQQMEPWQRLGLFQEALGGPIAGGGTTSVRGHQTPSWGSMWTSMI